MIQLDVINAELPEEVVRVFCAADGLFNLPESVLEGVEVLRKDEEWWVVAKIDGRSFFFVHESLSEIGRKLFEASFQWRSKRAEKARKRASRRLQ